MNSEKRNVSLKDEVDFIFRDPALLGAALNWSGIALVPSELKTLCEMYECRRIDNRNRFDSAAQKLLESFIPRVELYCVRIRPGKQETNQIETTHG